MKFEPRPQTHYPPLGEILRENDLITDDELAAALAYKNEKGVKLGQALVALGLVDEGELALALRRQGKVHCIVLTPGIVDRTVARRLGEETSRRFKAVAINRIASTVTLALEDPGDVYSVDELARQLDAKVFAVYAEPKRIIDAIDAVFNGVGGKSGGAAHERPGGAAGGGGEEAVSAGLEELVSGEFDDADVKLEVAVSDDEDDREAEAALDQPVVNLVRGLLEEAFDARASDIHLEPKREGMSVRFRVDGGLYERLRLPRGWVRPVIARLKVLANMDIAQRRLPQDGRTQIEIRGRRVDLRIATTPTLVGEGAVLRILDGGREQHTLEGLGMEARQLADLHRFASFHEGFVLATGPTGSGKTTTLYGLLQHLAKPDKKVITLEDPVENELDAATQINCNAKIGLTFATGLRSILRQDPDVVLVGEIRDEETAQIGVQAAMTGHMVLSTLHTVGSAEAITRLQDMGVVPYLLAEVLRGIVAQRLVRKLCEVCKREDEVEPALLTRLGIPNESTTFFTADGCEECRETGFKGRRGVYEVLSITPRIADIVRRGAGTTEIVKAAVEGGMTTLMDSALRLARAGETSLEEVIGCMNRGATE